MSRGDHRANGRADRATMGTAFAGRTAMNSDGSYSYENGLAEFYRGEIIGEIVYLALIEATSDPAERLKLAHLLQLETETKAWLRPHMIRAGLSIAEPAELGEIAQGLISLLVSLDWSGKMRSLMDIIPDLVRQYGAYAEAARSRGEAEQAAVCDFMVDHELAQEEFARLELEGAEPAASLAPLLRQSRYPLPVGT